jgi:uncharacterized protein Yka (UPF0111/DUF47 family)
MREQVAQLTDLVEEHKRLLKLCREYTEALVSGDVTSIETTVQNVDLSTKRIGELEQQRLAGGGRVGIGAL